MDLELKTVLVTGGTGFIGVVLCERLAESGFKVYVLKRMESRPVHSHNNSIIYVTPTVVKKVAE
jgi:nucleoside-diphosphate-sugar epimerase